MVPTTRAAPYFRPERDDGFKAFFAVFEIDRVDDGYAMAVGERDAR